jgi:hypothetical protein
MTAAKVKERTIEEIVAEMVGVMAEITELLPAYIEEKKTKEKS